MSEEITLDPAFDLDEDERRILIEALKCWWGDEPLKEQSTGDLLIANRLLEMLSNP